MIFVIFGTDKAGMEQVRNDTLEEFRSWMDNHPDHPGVTIQYAGPTYDDAETMNGSLVVIEAPSLEAARAFAFDSPLYKRGLYAEFHVRPWDWRRGRPD